MLSVALPLAGSAILLISCGGRQESTPPSETLMTQKSDTLTLISSKNGDVNYRFYTPLMEQYDYAKPEPYREFRRGIDIVTYDSLGNVKSSLVASYAINFMDQKLWEAKGDVRGMNEDGHILETQQLFWNQTTKRIWSNVHTRIIQGEDILTGDGFESDEEFKVWEFRRPRGRLRVNVEPTRPDSTAVDSMAVDGAVAGGVGSPDAADVPASDEAAAEGGGVAPATASTTTAEIGEEPETELTNNVGSLDATEGNEPANAAESDTPVGGVSSLDAAGNAAQVGMADDGECGR